MTTPPQPARSRRAGSPDPREAPALRIATAALDPRTAALARAALARAAWLPLLGRTGIQVPLIDLDEAVPDPWLPYRQEQARKRREVAERDRMYRDDRDDNEGPIPEGPALQADGEMDRLYGGPRHWASGRAAR